MGSYGHRPHPPVTPRPQTAALTQTAVPSRPQTAAPTQTAVPRPWRRPDYDDDGRDGQANHDARRPQSAALQHLSIQATPIGTDMWSLPATHSTADTTSCWWMVDTVTGQTDEGADVASSALVPRDPRELIAQEQQLLHHLSEQRKAKKVHMRTLRPQVRHLFPNIHFVFDYTYCFSLYILFGAPGSAFVPRRGGRTGAALAASADENRFGH